MKRKTIDLQNEVYETVRREAFELDIPPKKLLERIIERYHFEHCKTKGIDLRNNPATPSECFKKE